MIKLSTLQNNYQIPTSLPFLTRAKQYLKRQNLPPRQTLSQLKMQYNSIPPNTAVLGYCEDSLPVLLDLTDGRPGPLLVLGDPGCGKTSLIKVLLSTALAQNTAKDIRYLVITPTVQLYQDLEEDDIATGRCLGVLPLEYPEAQAQLRQVVKIVEERKKGSQTLPPLVVVLDDLFCVQSAPIDTQMLLETLIRTGAEVKVWVIAGLQTAHGLEMGRLIRYFRTRLLGRMPNQAAHRLGIHDGLDAKNLRSQEQFAVCISGHWLKFQMPIMNQEEEPQPFETGEDDHEDWNVVV